MFYLLLSLLHSHTVVVQQRCDVFFDFILGGITISNLCQNHKKMPSERLKGPTEENCNIICNKIPRLRSRPDWFLRWYHELTSLACRNDDQIVSCGKGMKMVITLDDGLGKPRKTAMNRYKSCYCWYHNIRGRRRSPLSMRQQVNHTNV